MTNYGKNDTGERTCRCPWCVIERRRPARGVDRRGKYSKASVRSLPRADRVSRASSFCSYKSAGLRAARVHAHVPPERYVEGQSPWESSDGKLPVMKTPHCRKIWRLPFIRLHYRLVKISPVPTHTSTALRRAFLGVIYVLEPKRSDFSASTHQKTQSPVT